MYISKEPIECFFLLVLEFSLFLPNLRLPRPLENPIWKALHPRVSPFASSSDEHRFGCHQ
jgi:hypothetical protein